MLQNIANNLNKYFSEVGVNIIREIEYEKLNLDPNHFNFKEIQCNSNLFLSPTNESEISSILSGLKRTSAPGHDGITLSDLLNIKDIIIEVVVNLVNNILSSGKFPSELKIVKICPIHKNGP